MEDRILTQEMLDESIESNNDLMKIVSEKKYQLRDKNDNLIEHSFNDVKKRIISTFLFNSQYEKKINDKIIKLIESEKIIPGGSILYGFGNNETRSSLSNCYLVPIEEDSLEGIFEMEKKLSRVFSLRGGSGTDIAILRPKGAPVNNAARTSSGAVSFLPHISETVDRIGQNGRRAACLVSIDCRHPDTLDFIWCKSKPEEIFGKDVLTGKIPDVNGANISVKLTDDFMNAVENDENWTFYFPDYESDKEYYNENWNGNYDEWKGPIKHYKTIKAREILKQISESAHISGDPGVMFITRAQKYTTSTYIDPKLMPISSNPCVTGDTLVKTINGDIEIKNVNVGDKILTFNIDSKEIEYEYVLFCKKTRENTNVIELTLENGASLKCTPDHKIYTENKGYIEASKLNKEDIIIFKKSQIIKSRIKKINVLGNQDVYDLTTEKNHNFFANDILVHNCGELLQAYWQNCLLGALVLYKYVINPFTKEATFDYESFYDDVHSMVYFMEVVSEYNIEKHPHKEQREIDRYSKQLGIEFTGLGDTFAMLGFSYGSEESIKFISNLMRNKSIKEIEASVELAKIFGPCNALGISDSRWDPEKYKTIRINLLDCDYIRNLELPQYIREGILEYGMRHTALNTVGPCGSISIIVGNCTSGIEPLFAFTYKRQTRLSDKIFDFIHPIAANWMKENKPEWIGTKTLSEIKNLMNYVESHELNYKQRIKVQSAIQNFTDHSISSTVNLPENSTKEDIFNIYLDSWKAGLKGITIFRDGSKKGVLSTGETKTNENGENLYYKDGGLFLKDLLDIEIAERHKISWKGTKIYCIVSLDEERNPLEVFVKLPREAGINGGGLYSEQVYQEKYSLWETITRLVSILLRSGAPLQLILDQLDKGAFSISDAASILARVLRHYLPSLDEDEDEIIENGLGEKCIECGENTYIYENGCGHCLKCGYSTCG